jgi:large subunit ribosomal protein L15
LHLRLPKLRGFNNPFRVEYQVINLDTIVETGLTEITPQLLHEKGLVRKNALVKILGRGEISTKVDVSVHAISKSAQESITAAGGSITILPKPWGDGRPPAKGNALTNR